MDNKIHNFLNNIRNNITTKEYNFGTTDNVPTLYFRDKVFIGDKGLEEFSKYVNNIIESMNLSYKVFNIKEIETDNGTIVNEEVMQYSMIHNHFDIMLDNYAIQNYIRNMYEKNNS